MNVIQIMTIHKSLSFPNIPFFRPMFVSERDVNNITNNFHTLVMINNRDAPSRVIQRSSILCTNEYEDICSMNEFG